MDGSKTGPMDKEIRGLIRFLIKRLGRLLAKKLYLYVIAAYYLL